MLILDINPRHFHVERLLRPKFYTRCNSCMKCLRTRLEFIKKRRNVVQKFLKEDIVELFRNDLGVDAYRKAGELLMEQNMSCRYELVEKFIGCISDHLEALCNERDCPDECKEAVQSLIYAAARFADLPELRELRTLFTEKFGNSLQPYINKEFEGRLRRELPTKEMKIQLLHDIAQEFSIEFDGKALEQRGINTMPLLHQERLQLSGSEDETSTDTSSHDGIKDSSSSVDSGSSEDELLDNNNNRRPIPYKLSTPPYFKAKDINININADRRNLEKTADLREKQIPMSVRRRRPLKASSGHQPELMNQVHYKLPSDYDELAARVASLSRG